MIAVHCDDQGFFEVRTDKRTWAQDRAFRPVARRKNGDLYFDEAPQRTVFPYETGVLTGWRVRYAGYADGTEYETIVAVEKATLQVRAIFAAIRLEKTAQVEWPAPFTADEAGSYAVLTHMQGTLLKTDDPNETKELPFLGHMCSCSAYMPWFGEITPSGGYLCHVHEPWDTAYRPLHPAGGPTRMILRMLPSLGRMEGTRSLTYVFTEPGSSYNTLCKIYRGIAKERGLFVTLRQKQGFCASLPRLIGASVLHLETKVHISPDSFYYSLETPEKNDSLIPFIENERLVKKLSDAGAPPMYLHLDGWGQPGYDNQHPDYLPPCREAGGYAGLTHLMDACRSRGHLFGLHDQYRDYYLDAPTYDSDQAAMQADGSLFELARWAGGKQNYLCPMLAPDYVRRNYTELFQHGVRPDCVYLDVFTCNEPDECLNPRHRVTRKESLEYRLQCFRYMLMHGVLPSSEEAADWAMPALVFCHWAPHAAFGIPVPLLNLVYHECFLIPWKTGKGSWGTPAGQPGFLHALLNAGMGYVEEKLEGKEQRRHFDQLRVLSALQIRLAHEEMVAHRFLGDGRQQTLFSDGTRVTVDFENETYAITPGLE